MTFHWGGKLRGRSWPQTLSQGITQIFNRVLGTTVVLPSSPRSMRLLASRSNTPALLASRSNAVALLASE